MSTGTLRLMNCWLILGLVCFQSVAQDGTERSSDEVTTVTEVTEDASAASASEASKAKEYFLQKFCSRTPRCLYSELLARCASPH